MSKNSFLPKIILTQGVNEKILEHKLSSEIINQYIICKELGARIYETGTIATRTKNIYGSTYKLTLEDILECENEVQLENRFHTFKVRMFEDEK